MQASRLKEDDEGLNCSGQLQSNTPVGLKSDYRDAGRTSDEWPVAPVDLVSIAKLKFNERSGPGWNWMDQQGVP
jgi:hypothetical protein